MKKRILRFEITDKCNQRCNMCWSLDWTHKDMDWEYIEKMILDYSKCNPNGTIVLTSREPLLSSNIENTLNLAKKLNIQVKLLTNGTLLNDHYCKMIMESTIDFISISIHGSEKEHNEIVRCPNSYQKIIKGLEKLNEYKDKYKKELEIRITTVINDKTKDNLDSLIQIAKENKTTLRLQHLMWHPSNIKELHKKKIKEIYNYEDNDIDGFLDDIDIKPEYVIDLINIAEEKCKIHKIPIQIYPELSKEEINNWYAPELKETKKEFFCNHVDESIRIRANGDITLCQYIDKSFGNIKNKSIKELMEDEEYNKIANELKNGNILPICLHCCHLRTKKENNNGKDNLKI